jgi:four helix bundle protein
MKFDKLEDIIAWQKARSLTVAIYETFNEIRDFGFKDQIEKAGISFMNKIAEGYERFHAIPCSRS